MSRLKLLQNSLARAVNGSPKTEYIIPKLKFLHLLNIEARIHYKIISLTTYFTHINHVIYVTSLTSNLTARLAHLTILHYSDHIYLLLKFGTTIFNKLLLPYGIIYNPHRKPLLTLHLTLSEN